MGSRSERISVDHVVIHIVAFERRDYYAHIVKFSVIIIRL